MKILKMNWFFWLAVLAIFAAGHSTVLAYTVNGHAECAAMGWALYGAEVRIFDVDPIYGGSYSVDSTPIATGPTDTNGNFTLTFAWLSGGAEADGPDLIFQFRQNVGNSVVTVYEELPTEAHWNVGSGDTLSFLITSPQAVCYNPVTPIGGNDCSFTRIGNCEIAHLSKGTSDPNSLGYFRARADGYTGNVSIDHPGTDTDQPFGATLTLFGWFGTGSDAMCYQVLYRVHGTTTWSEVDEDLSSNWYDTTAYKWVPEKLGPFSPGPGGSPTNLYKIPYRLDPGKIWSYMDRVALFKTFNVPDGLCDIKLKGYNWDYNESNAATPAASLNYLPDSEITIRVDNSPPTVQIVDLMLNGSSQSACEIVEFTNATDKIRVQFRVWDQKGHLGLYTLNAMYGHNCYVSPLPISPDKARDDYNNNASGSPSWQGSLNYNSEYVGGNYSNGTLPPPPCVSGTMPTCAYQFRLNVWKRTTDGYGLLYRGVEDTLHVTIVR